MPLLAQPDGSNDPGSIQSGRFGSFASGCLIAAVPLVLLFLPLLFHRSEHPAFGGFSRAYLLLLLPTAVAAVAVAVLVGWACRRTHGRAPAYSFVLSVAAIAGTLWVAEMALTSRLRLEDAFSEYRAWGHKRSLLFAFEATPNHQWVNAGATYSTDRFGFRTHVRGPSETSTGPRIFTVGESSVFGYGLNDDETWPHLLEAKLRTRLDDPSLTVVNAGNNGHTSLQTLFRFYTKVVPLKPTHVILYLGPNDVYGSGPDRLLISEEILFSGSVAQYWAAETRGKNLYSRSLLFYLLQHYVPAFAPKRHRTPEAGAPVFYGKPEMDAIGQRYLENVRTICLIARANGIEPVLVTFMQDMPDTVPFPPMVLRNNNELLRTFAKEQGVVLIDLEERFRASSGTERYFFNDRYHPNRLGVEFIASTLAQAWR